MMPCMDSMPYGKQCYAQMNGSDDSLRFKQGHMDPIWVVTSALLILHSRANASFAAKDRLSELLPMVLTLTPSHCPSGLKEGHDLGQQQGPLSPDRGAL